VAAKDGFDGLEVMPGYRANLGNGASGQGEPRNGSAAQIVERLAFDHRRVFSFGEAGPETVIRKGCLAAGSADRHGNARGGVKHRAQLG